MGGKLVWSLRHFVSVILITGLSEAICLLYLRGGGQLVLYLRISMRSGTWGKLKES